MRFFRKKKERNTQAVLPAPTNLRTDFQFVPTDPQGSYTGVPQEPYEVPVQDADDL